MKTLRHYFISDSLDDIDLLEEQLESDGLSSAQIHVLSNDEVGVAQHIHLHEVGYLMRQDVMHSTRIGATIGFIAAFAIMAAAYAFDFPQGVSGWLPYSLLAGIVFVLCTWEGGLLGIQEPNHHYRQFQTALAQGKHVFFVDLDRVEEAILSKSLKTHPTLKMQFMGSGAPHWLFTVHDRLFGFLDRNLLSQSQVRHLS